MGPASRLARCPPLAAVARSQPRGVGQRSGSPVGGSSLASWRRPLLPGAARVGEGSDRARPAQPGEAARGTRVVFKVSGNPSAAGGAGGLRAAFRGSCVPALLLAGDSHAGFNFVVAAPKRPVGSALGCAAGGGGLSVRRAGPPRLGRAWPLGILRYAGPAPAARPETWVRQALPEPGTRRAELCGARATFLPCGTSLGAAPGLPEGAGNQCRIWFGT